jgi:hypothetical protein
MYEPFKIPGRPEFIRWRAVLDSFIGHHEVAFIYAERALKGTFCKRCGMLMSYDFVEHPELQP